ncbi:outer membrane protein TolC [Maribacter spongiicola]|uniref:Outer membrane protein TolC n=1 Tax=Maribacter spongiicola TaxID=1206753 RepID=A0A4R7JWI7_9FLAO|nr:TolC family protein [Maribacter spongiicola]TDT41813.1 outer membrane protein TolC [Maribacter spongiicola]
MNQKFKITTLLLLSIWGSVLAQESWTLDECVSYAMEHNLQLNDFKYTNQSNRETYRQSVRNLLPSVNASSSYLINYGRAEDPNTGTFVNQDFYSNNYSLESSIDLFQGFQKINSIKASKLLFKATQEEVLQQKYLLAFRVMQAFYDIQFFEGLVEISKEQLTVSQTNYSLVEKQVELGLKAGADLYEAESLLLTDKLNVTQSKNQLASAKLTLIQEMNLENTSDITIQKDLEEIVSEFNSQEMKSDSVYTEAREFIPMIKAQEFRAEAAKKQVAVSRGRLYPSLSFFAGIGTGYFETFRDTLGNTLPFREQFRDNTSQYIGVNLNVPISNGWSARSRIKQSKIEKLRAENNLKTQEQVLFQAIQKLVQDYNSLLLELVQSNQKMEAQNLAFTIAQKRYEKGLINTLELFTAKNLYASAQNENLQVKLRSEINKSTLDFYRGLPVFNIEAP